MMTPLVFLYFVPIVLMVVVAAGTVVTFYMLPRGVSMRSACGGCGHEAVEPLGDRCNECGGRFVKVGLVTPVLALRFQPSLGRAILAWTSLAFVGAAMALLIVQWTLMSFVAGGGATGGSAALVVVQAVLVGSAIVYGVGCYLIVRRRRRLERMVHE